MHITGIRAREILDSRGNPTVEADVLLDDGSIGRAAVPSGASTGSYEAYELRDGLSAQAGDPPTGLGAGKPRYGGKGVLKAVGNVQGEIAKALVGMDASDQRALDETLIALDGTPNKSRLGANAILAVSLAAARAASAARAVPLFAYIPTLTNVPRDPLLPLPMCNIINGGAHTGWETTDVQEFMVMPIGARGFSEAVRMCAEIFHSLKKVLKEKRYSTSVGDEGGFAPKVQGGNEEALALAAQAVEAAGYRLGGDVVFALDVAATELWQSGKYHSHTDSVDFSAAEMMAWYERIATRYPIASIEDGLAENDWDGWRSLTEKLGASVQLVGDDLLVTNTVMLEKAIREKAGNATLIKPNQIGTLTETIAAVEMAQQAGWRTVMSHRSGETEDATIAHLAVGLACGQIKTGSLSRSDRVAKYNELLRIEELLGGRAKFAGNIFS